MTHDEKKRAIKFVAFWERLGNSGIIEFTACDMETACKSVSYLGSHCKVSVFQVYEGKQVFGEMK